MTKRTLSLFVLTLLMVAMFVMVTEASRVSDHKALDLMTYGAMTEDPETPTPFLKGTQNISLGSYGVNGLSPGYIVFRSYNDHPVWYDAAHLIDWRHTAKVHMIYMAQFVAGDDEVTIAGRWPHYNMFNATTSPGGVFVNGTNGVPMLTSPFSFTGGEPQMDVDNNGSMVSVFHTYIPTAPGATGNIRTADIYWEYPPGTATFLSDTVPQSLSQNPQGSVGYPFIEFQENGGTFVTHVLATEFSKMIIDTISTTPLTTDTTVVTQRASTYWRRVGQAPTLGGWTTGPVITESGGNNAKICAARGNQDVAIVFLGELTPATAGSMPFALFSHDMGATWETTGGGAYDIKELVNFNYGADGWSGWVEVNAMYDSDNYLHVIWNAEQYQASNQSQVGSINPTRIFHWTNRVAGPHTGGSISVVSHVEFNFGSLCGRGWTNELNTARHVIGECNDRLYVLWQQFGDPEFGDSLDCADESVIGFTGSYNSDIMMSVSLSKDGSLWDRRRNITNSKTPGCTGATNLECSSDQYPSVARYGMSVSSMGASYWSAVPEAFEVRDALDAGWGVDSTYLDLMFVDDAFPGNTRWSPADPQVWTNNPIKWVRLPCVPPVIEPSINVIGDAYLYPASWIKSGTSDAVTLTVENLGNAVLHVTSTTVTNIDAPAGAVTASPSVFNVGTASTAPVTVNINPGGFINPTPGTAVVIHATVDFHSDDPNRPVVKYLVNTVVADSVVQVFWDTVKTDYGYGFIVSNHGNGGRSGTGSVNLDFVNTGDECTAADPNVFTEDVYLYETTPLVMQSATNFSWNPFYASFDPKPYNFQPVPGSVASNDKQEKFTSGTFVTSDSAIGLVKTWWLPKEGFTNPGTGFIVEQMKVYSYDGAAHNGVRLGAWMDWDIPSDTGSNNFGGVVQADDYAWMTGREYNPGVACADSDQRFGASGMLGYYTTSEYAGNNSVNHTGLNGAYVHLDDDEFESGTDSMIVDSMWAWLNRGQFTANNSVAEDQQILLSYGSFNLTAADTLVIYTFHATIYQGDETALANLVDEAKTWYLANRADFEKFSCCGAFTNGYPGNTNCSIDGKRNLADITKLIDRVYISKLPLCCDEEGNVNASTDLKINLADITKLIDHVYISKAQTPPCL